MLANVVIIAFAVTIDQKGVKLKRIKVTYDLMQMITGSFPYFATSENKPTENSVSKKIRGQREIGVICNALKIRIIVK
jgi:hypothetical protein